MDGGGGSPSSPRHLCTARSGGDGRTGVGWDLGCPQERLTGGDRVLITGAGPIGLLAGQVVAAPQALRTGSARDASSATSSPTLFRSTPSRHHIVADTTVLVVVDIGTADPDASNFHQDLTGGLGPAGPRSAHRAARTARHWGLTPASPLTYI